MKDLKLKRPCLLFDLDGTLVSTEEMAQKALIQILNDRGIVDPKQYANSIVGRTWSAAVKILKGQLDAAGYSVKDPQAEHSFESQLIHEWKQGYRSEIENEAPLVPGIKDRLKELKSLAEFMGIVTGSDRDDVELILEQHGISHYFSRIWTSSDYPQSKPHPAPYLTAISDQNLNPASVLVFEDSVAGIASAAAAGLPWIQILNPHYGVADHRSLQIIPDWNQLDFAALLHPNRV
jgi:HAD superfamily hydrolase (TIGR01509 family)